MNTQPPKFFPGDVVMSANIFAGGYTYVYSSDKPKNPHTTEHILVGQLDPGEVAVIIASFPNENSFSLSRDLRIGIKYWVYVLTSSGTIGYIPAEWLKHA